jgi:hypothetical protein
MTRQPKKHPDMWPCSRRPPVFNSAIFSQIEDHETQTYR